MKKRKENRYYTVYLPKIKKKIVIDRNSARIPIKTLIILLNELKKELEQCVSAFGLGLNKTRSDF